jgi:redox-sensitive bicupin YhaK (pirin superfamily)
MIELRKSEDRGIGKQDWLDARFSFHVAPAGGFSTHEHEDTEVFSYVVEAALEHQDSMGGGSVVCAGDVIVMSTGSGCTHLERQGRRARIRDERRLFFPKATR